ncbi:MAG: integrase arm-type DNA-binding domain-containing protein [Methylococcaceae bacterium]
MLSDTAIRALKANPKPYKAADEKGLHVLINPNGSKYFRFKYRFAGKEKTLALGVYPETTLKQARDKRDEARKQIAEGVDPSEDRKTVKAAQLDSMVNTFEAVACEWGAKKQKNWLEKTNMPRARLEQHIFPWLGSKPIADISPMHILQCLQRLEARGVAATAQRTLRVCSQVFCYAVATGKIERDVTVALKGALTTADTVHFAAITEPKKIGELLKGIDAYGGTYVVRSALQLAPLVFVRPGELGQAEWAHIDLEAKEWRYFVTKTKVEHIVPLSTQAVEILTNLRPLTGHGRFVFANLKTPRGEKPMCAMTMSTAIRAIGYDKDQMTIHGFRAMARTILDEVLGFRPDFIEHQLAHAVRDANGRSYNRTTHLAERHKMMQSWADYLDGLKNGAQVIAFKAKAG